MSKIFDVSDDILDNIMLKLPAKPFAAAACVSRLWNKVTNSIFSRPRLASGFSLAVDHEVTISHEVNWSYGDDETRPDEDVSVDNIFRGISLVIGYVRGLRINVLPILRTNSEPQVAMVDKFLSDVRDFTVSVSGDTNPDPVGIMCLGNLKPILAEIDTKISRDTVMIGDAYNYFVCTIPSIYNFDITRYTLDGIALVFAKDIQTNEVEIKFHVGISSGIIPFGPKLGIICVWEYKGRYSRVLVRTEDELMPLDASYTLSSLDSLIKDELYKLYIGVKKEILPPNGGTPITYTKFHEIIETEDNTFIVKGLYINPGDSCLLYHSDVETLKDSNNTITQRFSSLFDPPSRGARRHLISSDQTHREKVFGGILFSSSIRGGTFFEDITDFLPFADNFPNVPIGGTFCFEPIGRSAVLTEEEEPQSEEERFNMQAVNALHLVMSYKML